MTSLEVEGLLGRRRGFGELIISIPAKGGGTSIRACVLPRDRAPSLSKKRFAAITLVYDLFAKSCYRPGGLAG